MRGCETGEEDPDVPSGSREFVRDAQQRKSRIRMLWLLIVVNSGLTILQLIAGVVARSLSLAGDAMMMSVDVVGYIVSMVAERTKTAKKKKRADRYGAVVSFLLLGVTTIVVLFDAIDRLLAPDVYSDVDGRLMIAFTVFNLAVDFVLLAAFRTNVEGATLSIDKAEATLDPALARTPTNRARVSGHEPSPGLSNAGMASWHSTPALEVGETAGRGDHVMRGDRGRGDGLLESPALVTAENFQSPPIQRPNRSPNASGDGPVAADGRFGSAKLGQYPDVPATTSSQIDNVGGGNDQITREQEHHGLQGSFEENFPPSCALMSNNKPETSLNMSAALAHLVADILRGVSVLVSGFIIWLQPGSESVRIDAACSLFVSLFILAGTLRVGRKMCYNFKSAQLYARFDDEEDAVPSVNFDAVVLPTSIPASPGALGNGFNYYNTDPNSYGTSAMGMRRNGQQHPAAAHNPTQRYFQNDIGADTSGWTQQYDFSRGGHLSRDQDFQRSNLHSGRDVYVSQERSWFTGRGGESGEPSGLRSTRSAPPLFPDRKMSTSYRTEAPPSDRRVAGWQSGSSKESLVKQICEVSSAEDSPPGGSSTMHAIMIAPPDGTKTEHKTAVDLITGTTGGGRQQMATNATGIPSALPAS
ncbi:unnamed protein product [Amoebophrya sp. A25]|nr:unnamed protein product [Amoebophrya sp. A25]|eukprot:GSA25T00001884001.1